MADENLSEYTLSEVYDVPQVSEVKQHRMIEVRDKKGSILYVSVDPSRMCSSGNFDVSVSDGRNTGDIPVTLDQNGNPSLAQHDGSIPPSLIPRSVLCEAVRILIQSSPRSER